MDEATRPPFWEPCGRKGRLSIFGVCCRYSLHNYIQWFLRNGYKIHHTPRIARNFDQLPLLFCEGYLLGMSRVQLRCADDLYNETTITGIPSAGFLAGVMDQSRTTMNTDGSLPDHALSDLSKRVCEFAFYYITRWERETGKRNALARRCQVRKSEIDEMCDAIEKVAK